ncbi:hypothetical protein [Enterobacter asburiae]|nr:hypothetical protein [Enterobacter ludwigii]
MFVRKTTTQGGGPDGKAKEGVNRDTTSTVRQNRKLGDKLYGTLQFLCLVGVSSLFVYGQIHDDIWSIVALVIGGILCRIVPVHCNRPDIQSGSKKDKRNA